MTSAVIGDEIQCPGCPIININGTVATRSSVEFAMIDSERINIVNW